MIDPETQSRLLDGARNLVRYVEINSQQQVLIHTEPGYDDPDVVGAVKSAIEETGAQVSVLHTPHWDKQYEPPPLAFGWTPHMHSPSQLLFSSPLRVNSRHQSAHSPSASTTR